MHFGNMRFKQKQREEQGEPDGTQGDLLAIYSILITLTVRNGFYCCQYQIVK